MRSLSCCKSLRPADETYRLGVVLDLSFASEIDKHYLSPGTNQHHIRTLGVSGHEDF